jgi:hypothetical protein
MQKVRTVGFVAVGIAITTLLWFLGMLTAGWFFSS